MIIPVLFLDNLFNKHYTPYFYTALNHVHLQLVSARCFYPCFRLLTDEQR